MARRKRKGTRRKQKIPIIATIGLLVALKKSWDLRSQPNRLVEAWTGYQPDNNTFNLRNASCLIPAVAGTVGSMAAAKIGLNRYIKIPMVKL